jgi:hypothetical protein
MEHVAADHSRRSGGVRDGQFNASLADGSRGGQVQPWSVQVPENSLQIHSVPHWQQRLVWQLRSLPGDPKTLQVSSMAHFLSGKHEPPQSTSLSFGSS